MRVQTAKPSLLDVPPRYNRFGEVEQIKNRRSQIGARQPERIHQPAKVSERMPQQRE